MTLSQAGRFLFPSHSVAVRRYLETALLPLYSRRARLRALVVGARASVVPHADESFRGVALAKAMSSGSSDWLLLRDYDGNGRERSVLFLFDGDRPSRVVKLRAVDAEGASLEMEAASLRWVAPMLDGGLRRTVPTCLDFSVSDGVEILTMSALPGRSLSVLMQRSLRPRRAHAAHLLGAARWLAAFHNATGAIHGDYWPRNLLFDGSSEVSGVVDWEHARRDGDRWCDVFVLPLLYAVDAPVWRSERPAATELRRAFGVRGSLVPAIEAYFREYARCARVSRSEINTALERFLEERDAELAQRFRAHR